MADKKISALTAASTPLAGTEVLPIVQGGSTVKVTVDNLTAGKNISANTVTANAGLYSDGSVGSPAFNVGVSNATFGVVATNFPQMRWVNATSAANEKVFDWLVFPGQLVGRCVDDTNGSANNWIEVERTGTTVDSVKFPQGNLVIGTVGKGVQGTGGLSNSTYAEVGPAGFLDLPISASGFVGTLSVSNTRVNFLNQSRRTVFGVACYGSTMTTTQLHSQDGSAGGATFSLSVVGGAIRVTDTSGSGSTMKIYIAFSGAFSEGS